jgi:hypothetical protein
MEIPVVIGATKHGISGAVASGSASSPPKQLFVQEGFLLAIVPKSQPPLQRADPSSKTAPNTPTLSTRFQLAAFSNNLATVSQHTPQR